MHLSHRGLVASLSLCLALAGCGGEGPGDAGQGGASSTVGGSGASGGGAASAGAGPASGGTAPEAAAGSSEAGAGASTAGTSNSGGASDEPGGASSAGGVGAGGAGAGGASAGGTGATAGTASGGGPAVNQDKLPATTLYLAGDSTVMTYEPSSAQEGWGQELGQYFISKLTIDNHALGGASIQTFQSRFTGIVSSLKAGDFVMADFGINDSGSVAGRSVTPADFQKLMSQMSAQTKAKQATFIIVTPSALQYWMNGMETNARLAPYVAVENMLGMSSSIPVDDLNARSLEFLNMIGQTAAMKIYINGDKAHFTKAGATQMAQFVAAELKRIANPLAQYLK